jgi:cysteinyl-tRNA synthetase
MIPCRRQFKAFQSQRRLWLGIHAAPPLVSSNVTILCDDTSRGLLTLLYSDAPSHLGHARTYVCLDVMRRVIEADATKAPLFVMNITDIDDKILAAAEESETSPLELARKYENEFWEDLDSLNCLRPHVVTRVTERVESDIIPYIQGLLDKGMAYQTEDGVYFHIKAFNEQLGHMTKYGKLAPPAASEDFNFLESGENNASPKKDKRDFVLWKNQKSEELVSWEAPWGNGRPGWHIECSAMIEAVQKQFQDTHRFLIHAGGVDLKFPHHTNEIAQSEAYTESDWINHWVHTGHLHIDGLKMSKSLKNFITIREFLGKYDLTSPLESPGT